MTVAKRWFPCPTSLLGIASPTENAPRSETEMRDVPVHSLLPDSLPVGQSASGRTVCVTVEPS